MLSLIIIVILISSKSCSLCIIISIIITTPRNAPFLSCIILFFSAVTSICFTIFSHLGEYYNKIFFYDGPPKVMMAQYNAPKRQWRSRGSCSTIYQLCDHLSFTSFIWGKKELILILQRCLGNKYVKHLLQCLEQTRDSMNGYHYCNQ